MNVLGKHDKRLRILLLEALSEFGVPEDQLENLGVINGMELDDSIEAGTKIKIIAWVVTVKLFIEIVVCSIKKEQPN